MVELLCIDETKARLCKIQVLRNANARRLEHGESRTINCVLQRFLQNVLKSTIYPSEIVYINEYTTCLRALTIKQNNVLCQQIK